MYLKDKYGIKIQKYDLLKNFHFVGARNKKYYMYKLVTDEINIGNHGFLECSHLDGENTVFYIKKNGETRMDIEILQGKNLDERKERFK